MPQKQNADNKWKHQPTMNIMPQKQNSPSKNSHQMAPKEMVYWEDTKQQNLLGHTNQVKQPPNSSLSATIAESVGHTEILSSHINDTTSAYSVSIGCRCWSPVQFGNIIKLHLQKILRQGPTHTIGQIHRHKCRTSHCNHISFGW